MSRIQVHRNHCNGNKLQLLVIEVLAAQV